MKLNEFQGKELFRKYGITTPRFYVVRTSQTSIDLSFPLVLKSQVPTTDRKRKGGVVFVKDIGEFHKQTEKLLALPIDKTLPEYLLAEEFVEAQQELYISISFNGEYKGPVLSLHASGGSGVDQAYTVKLDPLTGTTEEPLPVVLTKAGFDEKDLEPMVELLSKLWMIVKEESAALVEINPLFKTSTGFVAGDAKVDVDDATLPATEKEIVPLGGDIAVIASGGGASMLNIDILMRAGGRPANYVEYSGNPPASLVEGLTLKVLSQPGLKGVWVVGGTANFTDIYETLRGFADGLKRVEPKPNYPIVVRRDGPRRAEAKIMLDAFAQEFGFDLHMFGPEMSMAQSAAFLLSRMK